MELTPAIQDGCSVYMLPNGLTVAMERLPYLHSASIGVWIRTGSANEHPHEAGLAHFLEHLFFKGTPARSAYALMEEIEGRGGQFNAFTSREYTCLYIKVLAKHLRVAIDVLGDVIKNSLFCDLEKERNVILEEIASIEDTPDEFAHDLQAVHLWPDHALGRPISGTQESVSQLGIDKVRHFFEAWYRPENMVVSIAGNFDEEETLGLLRAAFEPIEAQPIPERFGPPRFKAGVACVERDIAQHHVCLGFPGARVYEDDRYNYELLNCILGGGSTSRLFSKIREDEGLAYAIYSYQASYFTAGMLGVYAAVAPQNLRKTLELTYAELARLRRDGIPTEELEANREQIKGNMLMALENTFTRMSRMAKSLMYYGRVVPIEEVLDRLDHVQAGAVQDLAQRVFQPESCALMVLGPPANGAAHIAL